MVFKQGLNALMVTEPFLSPRIKVRLAKFRGANSLEEYKVTPEVQSHPHLWDQELKVYDWKRIFVKFLLRFKASTSIT